MAEPENSYAIEIRVILISTGIVIGSALLSLVINGLLFTYGPWADAWVIEMWLGLTAIGALTAWLSRRPWNPRKQSELCPQGPRR